MSDPATCRGCHGAPGWLDALREITGGDVPTELTEIVSILADIGGILIGIDAKLQTIVTLIQGEDDDGD